MNLEVTKNFISLFKKLPERVQKTARKNYSLWKTNSQHPSLDFKKVHSSKQIYSIRIGLGWRAVGILTNETSIVWFWIGSHNDYDNLLNSQ